MDAEEIKLSAKERDELLKTIKSDLTEFIDISRDYRRSIKEDFEFRDGLQWTEAEQKALARDLRPDVPWNRVAADIDTIAGHFDGQRLDTKFAPAEHGDPKIAEQYSEKCRQLRERSFADAEERVAFIDMLTTGLGCTITEPGDDPNGDPIVRRLHPSRFLADPSDESIGFKEARWLGTWLRLDKREFQHQFPDATWPVAEESFWDFDLEDLSASARALVERRPRDDDYGGSETDANRPRRRGITVVEYQHWELIDSWRYPDLSMFDDQATLDHAYQQLVANDPNLEFAQPEELHRELGKIIAEQPAIDHTEKEYKRDREFLERHAIDVDDTAKIKEYRKAFVHAGKVLRVEQSPVSDFTIKPLTGPRDSTRSWGFIGRVHRLRGPQKFFNKLANTALHLFSTSPKNQVFVRKDAADPKVIERAIARGDAVIPVDDLDGVVERKGVSPPNGIDQLLQMTDRGWSYAGGLPLEASGMTPREQSAEVEFDRKKAAMAHVSWAFEAYNQYRITQGKLLLRYIHSFFAEPGRKLKPDADEEMRPDPHWAEYAVNVELSPHSANQRDINTKQLMFLAQYTPDILTPQALQHTNMSSGLVQTIMAGATPPPNPMAVRAEQAQVALLEAQVQRTTAQAQSEQADAFLKSVKAQVEGGRMSQEEAMAMMEHELKRQALMMQGANLEVQNAKSARDTAVKAERNQIDKARLVIAGS